MTDIFNIDLESEGFRKNSLDWRKFRANYNRLSASKLERGIQPLPLSLLLKLFGPQKVLTTYVVSRNSTNELDYPATTEHVDQLDHTIGEMKATSDKDKTVAKPLDFPGNGVFRKPAEESKYIYKKPSAKVTKQGALPTRPVFQRSARVPGRYFPKPTDEFASSRSQFSYTDSSHDRPQTQPICAVNYSAQTNAQSSRASHYSARSDVTFVNRTARVHKGPVCKATETLPMYSARAASLSGKSTSTVKSVPSLSASDFKNSRKGGNDKMDDKSEMFSISKGNNERTTSAHNGNHEPQRETLADYYSVKRLRLSARHVSFPTRSGNFATVLQGRPKTLHRRDDMDTSTDSRLVPRARTHVGFAESEMT